MLEMGTAVVPNSPFKKSDECDIDYGDGHIENKMYSLAIISMSWLFNKLKGKVEVGHCNNTKHDQGDRNLGLCVKGSEFHKKLYDETLESFEGVLQLARDNTPKIIASPQK
jgi:hypothetical protein